MAHRKVLSAEAPTAWDSACLSYCDSCPSYCGSYCCYVPPSPPPPVPPECSPAPSPTPPLDGGGGGPTALPPAVIVVIALLGGIFLLVSYYVVIAKSCIICRRRGRSRRHPPPDGGEGGGGWAEEFVEEGRVDHPIWYIRTVGLSAAAISSIAVYEYRKGEGLVEGSDCTVCLSEFSDGETLRVLPKCGHAFHVPCIDAWLRSHTNCPLCRAAIVLPVQIPLPPPERLSQRLDGGDRAAGAVVGGGENSNGATAGEGVEPGEPNGGGLPKEIEEVSGQNGQLGLVVEEEEEEEEGVVRVRRSFSVDSPFLVIQSPGGSEPESSDANTSEARPIDESQSSADRAGTSSRPAARSQSWSGRLFMPRPNSNTRNPSNSNLSR